MQDRLTNQTFGAQGHTHPAWIESIKRSQVLGPKSSRVWLFIVAQLLALLCLVLPSLSYAGTEVSGSITSNRSWTTAQSPYIVQGDVVVDNNAVVSIQAGVEIRMAANASLSLKKGAIQAQGTALAPVLVTSDAASAAPGDWRQWRFTAGTDNARTLLDHVIFEYGSGVSIESASPVIQNSIFRYFSGPALSIDLASSPIGRGNLAENNAINAIVVPAGTIRSQVVWGLVGIPYLVQQGIVQVGQAPLSLEPARLRLSPGVIAILRASLAQPAAEGGVLLDVASSVPSVASTVSRVTVAAGEVGADIELQAHSLGTTTLTLSHAQLGMAQATIEVVELPALSLVPGRPTLGVNRPYPMSLTLPAAAPQGGTTVQLLNSDVAILSAPSSVVVPSGQTGVSFEVTGLVDGQARLSARAEGYADGLSTIEVRGKALVLPASVVVAPGGETNVLLEITEPAPEGGLSVQLSTSNPTMVELPSSVTIAAGESGAVFSVRGQVLGTAELSAHAPAYQSTTASLLVDAISLRFDPSADITTSVDLSRTLRVLLSRSAPQGGVTIQVNISDPAIASVSPAELFVPQGQIYATVPITLKGVGVGQSTISLRSSGLLDGVLKVNVREKEKIRLQPYRGSKVVVGKGMVSYASSDSTYTELSVQRLINGSVASGADAVVVNLRCVDESVCRVPATVTIAAGQSQVRIPVTGLGLGLTQLEATSLGYEAALPLDVQTVQPEFVFNSLAGSRTTSSVRNSFSVSLVVPGASWSTNATLASAQSVQISLTEQEPAGVVNGVYSAATSGGLITQLAIAQGARTSATGYIAQPAQAGTYRVQAEIVGTVVGQSAVQTVVEAQQVLRLQPYRGSKVVVGKGMVSYASSDSTYTELSVQRLINGSVASGADAVVVNLRCVDESVCRVPATVTIAAGQSQVRIPVTGLGLGLTQLEATSLGYEAALPLDVQTVQPEFVFNSLAGSRTTSSVRNSFSVSLVVPGASWSTNATLASAQSVQISLTEQEPAGVVNGVYSAATSGGLITQLAIAQGARTSATGYIAQPAQAGTYRVQAEIVGTVVGQSAVQTVVEAQQVLRLQPYRGSKVVVGKGMVSYASSDSTYTELSVQRLINGSVASGADAVVVNLRCVDESVCRVPATVTIAAGQSQVRIPVTGLGLGLTQLEATSLGYEAALPLDVQTVQPEFVFNSLAGSRTTSSVRNSFSVSLVVPGASWSTNATLASAQSVQISLTEQEPAGVVNGVYSAATSGGLITQLAIAQGARTSATGYIAQPAQAGTYRVQAEIVGTVVGQSAVQTVVEAQQVLRLQPYRGSKVVVGKGMVSYASSDSTYTELSVQRLINGSVASGADAVVVNLRCVDESVCRVPATVTIAAGQSQVRIPVTGLELGSTQIDASAAGFEGSLMVVETVMPQLVLRNVPSTMTVGVARNIQVNATVPNAGWPNNQSPSIVHGMTFTSSVPSVARVTNNVNWNVGASQSLSASFTAISPGTTTVTVSAPGFAPATSAAITITAP